MALDEKMLLLRNYDLWADLTDDEYAELNILHNFIETKKGGFVYFEAFHHNKLYFIKEGYIKIGYIDNSGVEITKEIIRKGEIFGQITLEKNNLNGEFAQAYKDDVSLCAFTIDDFSKLLTQKPGLAIKFNKQIGVKFRQLENRLINLLNKDVRSRLLNFFCKLVEERIGQERVSGFCIPNYLTHEDIAHLIGSSRQTVTTIINDFAAEGLLTFNRQEICFRDVKELRNKANVV